jgi:uncharacterized protein DUF1203
MILRHLRNDDRTKRPWGVLLQADWKDITPMSIRVIAIPTNVANLVRSTSIAPGYGHPAITTVAAGYGPCRHCLREFVIGGENRILFTYDPFHGIESLPLPGPVFIHETTCARYDENAGFPAPARAHKLTLVAYGNGRSHNAEVHVDDGNVEPVLERLLARDDTRYVHVRDTEAGCYDFRIERAG